MNEREPYLFLLGLLPLVGLPLVLGIRTLLSSEERIIVPLLRMKTHAGERQAITYKRSMYRPQPVRPRSYLIATPAKFTQAGRIS